VQFSLVAAGWLAGFVVVGPVVAERMLGGAAAWGPVAGAFGAGLLAGGALGLRLEVRRPMLVATLSLLPQPLVLVLLMGPASLAGVAAGAFVAGLGMELFSVLWNTALQTHVPAEALSRVGSYDMLGSLALAPLGQALAGPAVEAWGTRAALGVCTGLIALPTLAACARSAP
jgi:hypothetical protein